MSNDFFKPTLSENLPDKIVLNNKVKKQPTEKKILKKEANSFSVEYWLCTLDRNTNSIRVNVETIKNPKAAIEMIKLFPKYVCNIFLSENVRL